jgi:hypothetical protein
MMSDTPKLGEVWYFFNKTGDGSGRYVLVTQLDPPAGVLLASKDGPLLKPTRRRATMRHSGFRYCRQNNTLTVAIIAADHDKLRAEFKAINELGQVEL